MWGFLFTIASAIAAVQGQPLVDGIAIPAGWAVAGMTPAAADDMSKAAAAAKAPAAKVALPPTPLQFVMPAASKATSAAAVAAPLAVTGTTVTVGYPPLPQPPGAAQKASPPMQPELAAQPQVASLPTQPVPAAQPKVVSPPAQPLPAAPVALHAVNSSKVATAMAAPAPAQVAASSPEAAMKAAAPAAAAPGQSPAPAAPAPEMPQVDNFVPTTEGVMMPPASEVQPSASGTPVMAKVVLDKIVSVECLQKTLKDAAYICDDSHYVGGQPPPPPPAPAAAAEKTADGAKVDMSKVMAAVAQAKQYAQDAKEATGRAEKAARRAEDLAEKLGEEQDKASEVKAKPEDTEKMMDSRMDPSRSKSTGTPLANWIPGVGSFVADSRHANQDYKKHKPALFKLVMHHKDKMVVHEKKRPSLLHKKR